MKIVETGGFEFRFENTLNSRIQKALKLELPVGKVSSRWTRALAESCHVVNLERLSRDFPGWSVIRANTAVRIERPPWCSPAAGDLTTFIRGLI